METPAMPHPPDRGALARLSRKELQKMAKKAGVRANNRTDQIISDLLTALGGASHHHNNPLAEGPRRNDVASHKENVGTFMSFPHGLAGDGGAPVKVIQSAAPPAACQSGENPMQSISVYTTAAKVPFGRKTVQTELEADAETPSRELERRPSDVAVPSGRSLLSSEDDKRGISPMKKLKHLMTGRRGFKVDDGRSSDENTVGPVETSSPTIAPSKSSLRKSILARAAQWASPQAQAQARTDEWLEVLKPSPALSSDMQENSKDRDSLGSNLSTLTSKGLQQTASGQKKEARESKVSKTKTGLGSSPSPIQGSLSPRIIPSGGLCGIGPKGKGLRRVALVKPRHPNNGTSKPVTKPSITRGQPSVRESQILRQTSIASMEKLGHELLRMQAELRKSLPRLTRPISGDIDNETKDGVQSMNDRHGPSSSGPTRTSRGVVRGPMHSAATSGLMAKSTSRTLKRAGVTKKLPGSDGSMASTPRSTPCITVQTSAERLPRTATMVKGTPSGTKKTGTSRVSDMPARASSPSVSRPHDISSRAVSGKPLPEKRPVDPSSAHKSQRKPNASAISRGTAPGTLQFPSAVSTIKPAKVRKTPGATPKLRGAPRCAYVGTFAGSGPTPLAKHVSKKSGPNHTGTPVAPASTKRPEKAPLHSQPPKPTAIAKPVKASSPRTPCFDFDVMADALQLAELVDPTPLKESSAAATHVQRILMRSVMCQTCQEWAEVPQLCSELLPLICASSGRKAPPFSLLLMHENPMDILGPVGLAMGARIFHLSAHAMGTEAASKGIEREVQDATFAAAMEARSAIIVVSYLDVQPHGKSGRGSRVQLISDLCLYLDACESRPQQTIAVVVTSSRPETLGDELLSHLPLRILLPLPNISSREEILFQQLAVCSDSIALGVEDFSELARMSAGFTAGDLKDICRSVLSRKAENGHVQPAANIHDFAAAIKSCGRSVPAAKASRLELWGSKNSAIVCGENSAVGQM